MTRLLVVDDHPAYRRGLELMLADAPDIALVGEADTGERALEQAATLAPDVILMDLRMPGLDGIEATTGNGRCWSRWPPARATRRSPGT